TFLEYFCAAEFVWKFEKERKIDIDFLKNELYCKHFQDEAWDEVLRLIAGMIEPRFVREIIEALMTQTISPFDFMYRDYNYEFFGASIFQSLSFYLLPGGIAHLILAAHCIDEIRNRHEINGVDNTLLKQLQIETLKQYPYHLDESTAKTVIGLISSVWSHNNSILAWLKSCVEQNTHPYLPTLVVKAITSNWKFSQEISAWLKDLVYNNDDSDVRSVAVQELAKGWKDSPDTLHVLKDLAQKNNENADVRSAAIQGLAKGWKDAPDTLTILKDRAKNDEQSGVCNTALQELTKGWKDDPDILSILKDVARNNNHRNILITTVRELAKSWKGDLDV
ncbi:MAG: HEAT repeat domain-containing protein, partial [Cyanobacteria bacterium J06649_11]